MEQWGGDLRGLVRDYVKQQADLQNFSSSIQRRICCLRLYAGLGNVCYVVTDKDESGMAC